MKTAIILASRLGSKRLKGKLFLKLEGKTILEQIVLRLQKAKGIDELIVAVPKKDLKIISAKIRKYPAVRVMAGPEKDVLSRYRKAAQKIQADTIIRATGDNPFVDIKHLELALKDHIAKKADYTTFIGLPIGCGIEVISKRALNISDKKALKKYDREHITQYILRHKKTFKLNKLKPHPKYRREKLRLTVDTKTDYDFAKKIYSKLSGKSLMDLKKIIDISEKLT